jgi:hypothetical protein
MAGRRPQLADRGAARALRRRPARVAGAAPSPRDREHLRTRSPPALLERLDAERGPALRLRAGAGRRRQPEDVLVVGSVLDVPELGQYRLLHVFPLSREREILQLVQRTAAAPACCWSGCSG